MIFWADFLGEKLREYRKTPQKWPNGEGKAWLVVLMVRWRGSANALTPPPQLCVSGGLSTRHCQLGPPPPLFGALQCGAGQDV